MNVTLKVQQAPDAATIAHSIMAYDRVTEELVAEIAIPLFLDTLAVKLAHVPPEDKYGALSYPLGPDALGAFRFLLGFAVDHTACDCFLESTTGRITRFRPAKLEALEILTQVTPHPRYTRTATSQPSERELVLPILRLLSEAHDGCLAADQLAAGLAKVFATTGPAPPCPSVPAEIGFAHKVRNVIAHRDHPSSFIRRGLAHYIRNGLQISVPGRSIIHALLT